ncbi:Fanconi anemia core complex-associated protein 20 [Bombina bombina]|uniref:Fanconi anemia core complex-associated protein 20 n=1 Tax=Bombina bombina TaxID=8345 RepID=UPI00235B2DD9|nr:Fanconi anemia core complex-associated protein 20 [Bombina bombina]
MIGGSQIRHYGPTKMACDGRRKCWSAARIKSIFKMSEDRAAKLKLKRRKGCAAQDAQVSVAGLQAVAPVPRRSSTSSWFDEIELTGSQQMWKQVLNAAFPDLKSISWDAVPSLPNFGDQVVENEKAKHNCKVFSIGEKKFKWDPFPDFPGNQSSDQTLINIQDNDDGLGCNEKRREHLEENFHTAVQKQSLVGITENPEKRLNCEQICNLPEQNNKTVSTKSSEKIVVGLKTTKKPSLHKQTSTKNTKQDKIRTLSQKPDKKIKQNLQTQPKPDVIMVDISDDDAGTSSAAPQTLEKDIDKADGAKTLASCPICLMQFPKPLSQLDIDSHLAQCLSETTIDIMW